MPEGGGEGLGSKHNSQVFCVPEDQRYGMKTRGETSELWFVPHTDQVLNTRLTSYEVRDLEQFI